MKNKVILIIILLITYSLAVTAIENRNLRDFTKSVYSDYTSTDFNSVYQYLHPDIKKVVSRDEYIVFQQKTTEKYQMNISDVIVGEATLLERNPVEYKDLINDTGSYYTVNVKYKLQFKYAGKIREKEIAKDTFLFVDDEQKIYLLWNPEIIKDDSQNG